MRPQGERQGNDVGEHYRSALFCYAGNHDVDIDESSQYFIDSDYKITREKRDHDRADSTAPNDQLTLALHSLQVYEKALNAAKGSTTSHKKTSTTTTSTTTTTITTRVEMASSFHYADDYHQQYLHKNPHGYCMLGGCGVVYPKVE